MLDLGAGLYKSGPGCPSQGEGTPQQQQKRHHGSGRRKRRAERRAGHVEELGGDNVGIDESPQGVGDHNYPMKRSRLVWTPELHQRFLEAVNRLGNDAVPKNIMQVCLLGYSMGVCCRGWTGRKRCSAWDSDLRIVCGVLAHLASKDMCALWNRACVGLCLNEKVQQGSMMVTAGLCSGHECGGLDPIKCGKPPPKISSANEKV